MKAKMGIPNPEGRPWTPDGIEHLVGQRFPVVTPGYPSVEVEVVAAEPGTHPQLAVVTVEAPRLPAPLMAGFDQARWN